MGRGVCDLFNGLLVLSDHSMDCDVMWTMCGREGVFPGPRKYFDFCIELYFVDFFHTYLRVNDKIHLLLLFVVTLFFYWGGG